MRALKNLFSLVEYENMLFLIFLTIFLQRGIDLVNGGSKVKFLPGFEGPLPFELETGYIGVDEGEIVQLFYYFVKSESNPNADPLILWLTGGPGCSAFSALVYDLGPIKFEEVYDGSFPKLTLTSYSWTKVASIIFLDLPVGTGFSYAKTVGADHSSDTQACDHAYQFLQNWLVDHPKYTTCPFYVAGDSYTGKIIPRLVQLISNGNEMGKKEWVNLKGYILGNPLTFLDETNYRIPYAHGMGLISDELYQSLKTNCRGKYTNSDSSNLRCSQDLQTFDELVDGISLGGILDAKCSLASPRLRPVMMSRETTYDVNETRRRLYTGRPFSAFQCHSDRYRLSYYWANDASVQEALHIRKGSKETWQRCNTSLSYTYDVSDSTPYHANLSTKGYRSLVYSGDHDMTVPFLSTQAWIRSLNYSIVEDWRQWIVEGQTAGYTRTYANNMTFATVKGAGHAAPEYFPLECAAMFQRWISYGPL